jgi:hypothetical protein
MISRDIGNYIKIMNGGGSILSPGDADADIEGVAIDRSGYLSGVFAVHYGIDGPSIDGQLGITAKIQESTDNSNWSDVSGATIALACVTLTASNVPVSAIAEVNVDFSSLEKYVRAVVTPTRSSAESDTAVVGITAILGGADVLPV